MDIRHLQNDDHNHNFKWKKNMKNEKEVDPKYDLAKFKDLPTPSRPGKAYHVSSNEKISESHRSDDTWNILDD